MHVHYRPSPEVLDHVQHVDFLAVVGPTSVGKTTLMHGAAGHEPDLHQIIGTTSRGLRPGERDGADYHFPSRDVMVERIKKGGYVEVAPEVLGDLYAIAPEDLPTEGIGMFAVVAQAMETFRALPFKRFRTIFVLPGSWEGLQAQTWERQFTPSQLALRMAEARRSVQFALEDTDRQFVINRDIKTATQDFVTLAMERQLSDRLKADQELAPTIARTLLEHLERA